MPLAICQWPSQTPGVKQGRRRRNRVDESESFTAADLGRLVGIALVLVFFLLVASVPQIVFRWWKREGYQATQIEILSPPSRQRSMRVRVTTTGEELWAHRSSFDDHTPHAFLPAWFNPDAKLVLVFTVFDERVLSAQRYREPTTGGEALGGIVATLVAGGAGAYLVLRRDAAKNRSRA
jgi:hypothetical protein